MQSYLNGKDLFAHISVTSKRELGIASRTALIFSRRGLDISEMSLVSKGDETVVLDFKFWADFYQLRSVCADMEKLYPVEQVLIDNEAWRNIDFKKRAVAPQSEGCL